MKNSLFDSLFSSKSHVYLPFLEKMPFMALYNGKIALWCSLIGHKLNDPL